MKEDLKSCHPLTLTRALVDMPIGNLRLAEHQSGLFGGRQVGYHPHAWIDPADWWALVESGQPGLATEEGELLAWLGEDPDPAVAVTASDSFIIRHPWDLLRANEQHVGRLDDDRIEGEVHPAAVIEGRVWIGPGTRILPGVFIEGNVVIGADCRVGPNCHLRGNTSIGDGCHIGQSVEIKNSLILPRTHVGHLSYVGDSILGEGVNFGAGTMVSNWRHDGTQHRSVVAGVLVDTGRDKLGAIVGDGVHTGIQTSIYPGRKLWPGTTTRPGEVVERDIER